MNGKLLGVAPMALLLCACAHAYPDLATFQSVTSLDESKELEPILAEAERLQGTYSAGYKETARWQDISQLPVIGAAAVAAWILLKDQNNAAKKAGKIGIGTLAYTNARGQLSAEGLPEAYIKGHGALTCILAEGAMFHGDAADRKFSMLNTALQQIANDTDRLTQLRYKDASKGNQELLKTARTVADQALTAARAAETASLKQIGAHDNAVPAFRKAVSSVSVSVASKGRARQPVDFASLRDAMGAAKPPTKAVSLAEIADQDLFERAMRSDDAGVVARALAHFTSKLMTSASRLAGATPDYAKSITNLGDCTKQAE